MKKMILSVLSLSIILFIISSIITHRVNANEIDVSLNEYQSISNPPLMKNGRILLPLRELATIFEAAVFWDESEERITIIGVEYKIEMYLNKKEVALNEATAYQLDVPPVIHRGITYVPVRNLSDLFNVPITWDEQTSTLHINNESKYVWNQLEEMIYWVDKNNGMLYGSNNREMAMGMGDTNIEIIDRSDSTINLLNDDTVLLEVHSNYGEPHINDEIFKILIKNGNVVYETDIKYHGHNSFYSIRFYQDYILMLQDSTLNFVKNTGEVAYSYDLSKITEIDDIFTVEWVNNDYLLIRPYQLETLMLINRHTNETTLLYKNLANHNVKQLIDDYVNEYPHSDFQYAGDNLRLLEEKDGVLYFQYDHYFSSEQEIVEYKLNP
ncbi:stalk domain-containing protein [Bacillus solimangrovi]|uniref:Copper amine oxidase-like N-terminal domain-containing protein n=1 Tax=Bacillus solimangrovi TaxID=1305675 RepID=A0A1E5LKC1_9BACI|nr:stalk domain-containing protein [Bacillus solimangrovi]OEH94521.1 hypothetical protein BFG57_07570 [Bacillus solimangrovi]